MNACDCLPICAIVNDKVFAVHAGISPLLKRIEDIDAIDRFQEIPLISFPFYKVISLIRTKVFFVIYYGQIHHQPMAGHHQIVE